jgi:diguanylate cyclase (GGDEF)-like protein
MEVLKRLPLRYKFWAVNGIAFLSTLLLVLLAMALEQRSVNQARQEQALGMLTLWQGTVPGGVVGPLQLRPLPPDSLEPLDLRLRERAGPEPRWVESGGLSDATGGSAIGAWVVAQADAGALAVLVSGKTFRQIFLERAPVYALVVLLLMCGVLLGSQLLIRFVDNHQRQLQALAHSDPLTGLPNRILAQDRLSHGIDRILRRGGHLAVLFIDLDRFKTLNDGHGHAFGDMVLRATALRLLSRCREEDTLARLGGDEFLLILEQIPSPALAGKVAQQLLSLLETPLQLEDGREVFISASIGVAVYPEDGRTSEELVRNADAAMYLAKSQGRNTHSRYLPCLTERARERFELDRALRTALVENELEVHYQPLMDLQTGQCIGAEALLRWNNPQRGRVSPAQFVPLAEESGLIVPIGAWVLQRACRQGRLWLDQGLPLRSLAVNLSPIQFVQQDIAQLVAEVLAATRLPAACLELEITEGALMRHTSEAEATLRKLRSLGVRVALDDFGTGYSSLAYLRRFALDKLKIDRGFLLGVPSRTGDARLVETIIELGRNLGLTVLAEGIETAAQVRFLVAAGCSQGQGFRFARPMPADRFGNWWRRSIATPPGLGSGEDPEQSDTEDDPVDHERLHADPLDEGQKIVDAQIGTDT